MIRFSRVIFGSLGLLACALFFSLPASAAVRVEFLEPTAVMSPYHPLQIYDDFLVEVEARVAIVQDVRDDGQKLVNARSIGLLTPEYAESFDTNGLNFIEVRRRC